MKVKMFSLCGNCFPLPVLVTITAIQSQGFAELEAQKVEGAAFHGDLV